MDWEQIWAGIGSAAAVAALTLGLTAIIKPHKIDGYYLSHQNSQNVCVYAHWTWHSDEVVYCTDRPSDAIDFAVKANALVK